MIKQVLYAAACAALVLACGGRQSEPTSMPVAPSGGMDSETHGAGADDGASAASAPMAATDAAGPVAADAQPAELGKPAPDFALVDHTGAQVSLASQRGKTVVLEWFNPECPFVKYAHGQGPLKDSAAVPGASDPNVVWLAINSSAAGKQGHGTELNARYHAEWRMGYPVLLDETGAVGRLYAAKTTPHMFIIDPQGTLVYRGALDNAPLGQAEGGKVTSYVADALVDVAAGQPVRVAETRSYGCSVKY